MDDSELVSDYSRQMDDSCDQLYSQQQRPNGHADYYGYGNR